jgi:hypothetical protein
MERQKLILQPKDAKIITVRVVSEPLRDLERPVRARAD